MENKENVVLDETNSSLENNELNQNQQPLKKEKVKISGDKILFGVVFTFFAIYAFLLIYPLVWGFLSSLKERFEYRRQPFALPKYWLWENYPKALDKITDGGFTFLGMFWNSLWFAGGSCLLNMEVTVAFAYVLNKYKFRGRNFLYNFQIFLMSVPIGSTFISTYRLYHALGLVNSPMILLSALGGYGMNLIICHSYWGNISWSYAEAAQIDGANFFQVYLKAMLPQAMPIMVTLGLLGFIGKWNDYMAPMLYLSKMPTLALGLFRYRTIVERSGEYPVLFAGLILCMIPILILFAIFSDKLMQNMSIGGLKG